MVISKTELLNMYEGCYDLQSQISELQKEIRDTLKDYATNNELNPKAVSAGYRVYKSYKLGKIDPEDVDYISVMNIVEESFGE